MLRSSPSIISHQLIRVISLLIGILSGILVLTYFSFEPPPLHFCYLVLLSSGLSCFFCIKLINQAVFLENIRDSFVEEAILDQAELPIYSRTWLEKLGYSQLAIVIADKSGENQCYAFYLRKSGYQILGANNNFQEKINFGHKFDGVFEVSISESIPRVSYQFRLFCLQLARRLWLKNFGSESAKLSKLAERDFQAKAGFLANLSHEIRAPLGVILNATELVLDGLCGEINENQKKFLGLSKKSSDHLLDLIGDVLDYAKIEAGKIAPQPKDLSLEDLLKDILNITRLLAESKKIEIVSRDSSEVCFVNADKKHLRQILINLATNAVKYTQDHGRIEIWAERVEHKNIKISVKDSGVGISQSERHKVFKPFERLDDEYSKQQGGVGIGLSLAKKLAELNNGELDFISESGSGSTFFLLVPESDAAMLSSAASTEMQQHLSTSVATILLLESDPDQLDIISTYLINLGYSVSSFVKFENAQEAILRDKFSVLIFDNESFDQNVSNRQQYAELFHSQNEVPLILLSSRAFVFDLERYLKLGVERCLPKPAPLKELANLIDEIVARKQD